MALDLCLRRPSDLERVLELLDFDFERDLCPSLDVFHLGIQNHVLVVDFEIRGEKRESGELSLKNSNQFESLLLVYGERK